jgi:hypothetical protein
MVFTTRFTTRFTRVTAQETKCLERTLRMLDEMGDDQFKLAFSRARTPMDLCDPDEVRLFTTYSLLLNSLLLTLYYLLFTTYSLLLTL